MTKHDYLNALKLHLNGLHYDEITEILSDIEEHFDLGIENGRSEAEIAEALGSPQLMALGLITENTRDEKKDKPLAKGVSLMRLWMVFIGIGFTNLLVLPIFIVIAGLIFGLFVTLMALYFAGGMLIIAPGLKMISESLVSNGPIPVIFLPLIGIALIYGTRRLHIAFNIISKRLFAYGLKFTEFSKQVLYKS